MWSSDSNNQQMYQQYAQAYSTGNYSAIDPNQAPGHLQALMQNIPANEVQQLFAQHFNQMSPDQRSLLAQQMPPEYGTNPNDPVSLAQSFQRMSQERPDMLQRIFSHPVLVSGAVGLTALLAKHMMEKRNQYAGTRGQQYGYGNPGQTF